MPDWSEYENSLVEVSLVISWVLDMTIQLEKDPPIQEVIDSGIVPRLKDFLMNDKEPYLQVNLTHQPAKRFYQ